MRRPTNLINSFHEKSSQQGYALFIVLMIMIVIALLVVTAVQSYNTEQRISTNEADRKLAMSLAEAALREGENKIIDFDNKVTTFTADCKQGLCLAQNIKTPSTDSLIKLEGSATDNAWQRSCDKELCIDKNGQQTNIKQIDGVKINPPRYIIEYISTDTSQGSMIYRVTAKAWGKNNNTVVMLQSYVANE